VQPVGAPGGERQPEEWVEDRGDGEVRQPQPVECGDLERLGERRHLRSGERPWVGADGEADLHFLTT
jgi:hypothetical protein